MTSPLLLLDGVSTPTPDDPAAWPPEQRSYLGSVVGKTDRGHIACVPWMNGQGPLLLCPTRDYTRDLLFPQIARWVLSEPETTLIYLSFDSDDSLNWLASLVPEEGLERGRLVILNPGDQEQPVGFSSLVPDLEDFRRQRFISSLIHIKADEYTSQLDRMYLDQALETLCAATSGDRQAGRTIHQHTLLDVCPLYLSPSYRAWVLNRLPGGVHAAALRGGWRWYEERELAGTWFHGGFEESSLPRLLHPFLTGSLAAVLGQRTPKLDLKSLLLEHRICLVPLERLKHRGLFGMLFLLYLAQVLEDVHREKPASPFRTIILIDEVSRLAGTARWNPLADLFRSDVALFLASSFAARSASWSHPSFLQALPQPALRFLGRGDCRDAEYVGRELGHVKVESTTGTQALADVLPELPSEQVVVWEPQENRATRLRLFPLQPTDLAQSNAAIQSSRMRYGQDQGVVQEQLYARWADFGCEPPAR